MMGHPAPRNLALSMLVAFTSVSLVAQSLPAEFQFSEDGRLLLRGAQSPSGLYDYDIIRDVYLDFPQADFWTIMEDNYASETEIPATMTVEGIVYDSVGVRFRGNTSYFMIGDAPKKSFAVTTDYVHEDQEIMGYNNLKFNNAHQDGTFMREVLYDRLARKYTPIAKANYIRLYLNNEYWGIYPNIQSIDKTFLEQWFLSNDGARFRATVEEGGPGGGGPGWGDGTAGMNYLGADTADYQQYYDLKATDIDGAWQKLVDACQVLSTATAGTSATVNAKLDIDKILWFLAAENIFTDDDSYIMKGKQDYYVYYEPETDRTFPLEYDGNSSFTTNAATSQNWGPFKNAGNVNYPLLNKLLNIPEWRQRYLAHYRTILQETFTADHINPIIDSLDAQIAELVAGDPKKLYPTTQYTTGVPGLKTFVTARRNFLINNAEVAQVAPVIASASYVNATGELFGKVVENESVRVHASISHASGIEQVWLYYDNDLVGTFEKTDMYDDGAHDDGAAADGVYGASIPGFDAGTLVRYYIESIASNTAKSASYLPAGAEHDVFVYLVEETLTGNGVVINELLASNDNGATDEAGDHEDWIELYNNNDFEVDLSGFFLSDNPDDLQKWAINDGTIIPGNGYLIIWADEDGSEAPLHANFKLSASGETLIFSDAAGNALDQVTFGEQNTDVAYARNPNGTGNFVQQAPTFGFNNEEIIATEDIALEQLFGFPNPVTDSYSISGKTELPAKYWMCDVSGRVLQEGFVVTTTTTFDFSDLHPGLYYMIIEGASPMRLLKL